MGATAKHGETQYMVVGGRSQRIELERDTIGNTDTYDYLGVTTSEDGRDKIDITRKVGKSMKMIKMLHPILWNKNLTNKTKQEIFKTMVKPVMTYGYTNREKATSSRDNVLEEKLIVKSETVSSMSVLKK